MDADKLEALLAEAVKHYSEASPADREAIAEAAGGAIDALLSALDGQASHEGVRQLAVLLIVERATGRRRRETPTRAQAREPSRQRPRSYDMKKSKKASPRVTAPNQEAAAAAAASKKASRRKAVKSNAVENAAKRQFQRGQATAIQGHMRASGQRRQAKRDAR
jgi:hypothetical protein